METETVNRNELERNARMLLVTLNYCENVITFEQMLGAKRHGAGRKEKRGESLKARRTGTEQSAKQSHCIDGAPLRPLVFLCSSM